MQAERWKKVEQLYEAAMAVAADKRADFLGRVCPDDSELRGEVQSLLAQNADSFLEGSPLSAIQTTRTIGGPAEPGSTSVAPGLSARRIGPYELTREIGHGGMGSVYLAVRTDGVYSKPVAVKLLRAGTGGADRIERFRQERKVLASIDHPNVAQLLDGGETADGLPYYVMDYIAGEPIDVYCDQRRLTIQERLRLFQSVCAAVEHAHGRGIVHRDLKPGNILVNREGQVKLVDFGIAKLLGSDSDRGAALTRTGMLLMTPEYASPEQVRGETVGAATDIYSLGVVLFELLTGHSPYRLGSRLVHEIVRVVCEEKPVRPSSAIAGTGEQSTGAGQIRAILPADVSHARQSTPQDLSRSLQGDLDNIILKALRKGPAERYGSVREFAEDIQRYLEGKPVTARRPGWPELAGRLLNRYKWAAAGAVAAVLAIATGALRISPWAAVAIGCFAAMLVVLRWRLQSIYGQQYAARHLFLHTMAAVFNLGVLILVLALVYIGSTVPTYLFVALGLRPGYLLARWPWRDRWAGPLLLNPSATSQWKPRTAYLLLLLFIASLIFQILLAPSMCTPPSSWYPASCYRMASAFLFFQAAFGGWTAWLVQRVEIRARGPVYWGILIEWHKISSYAWEVAGQDRFVLRLRRPNRKYRSLLMGIPVAGWAKAELSAVLDRQLARWPDRDGKDARV
jgi:serine/threonine protein kinase